MTRCNAKSDIAGNKSLGLLDYCLAVCEGLLLPAQLRVDRHSWIAVTQEVESIIMFNRLVLLSTEHI